ncbi:MAG: efflux RND transporter periplasmic adaptor subunit [Calditrichaeota bacterium]|nr:efflux RND transporter periplasmic adaptor subunit [Calditrichota bacterium]
MSKRKIILSSIVFVVVLAIVLVLNVGNGGSDEIEVQTANVERGKVVQIVTASGRIQPKTQVKISADVAAKITRLEVREGDWVEKGQFLVELDRERFLASVERAAANMRSTESNAELARENMLKTQKDFERTKELFARKLESQAMLDQNSAAYQVEKARYQSALDQVAQSKASLKQTRDDLSKTTIYAPMAGTISELNKEIGEIALGSQFQEDVIMVISNLSAMEALVNVDENDIVAVAVDDTATIEIDAIPDRTFQGVVTEIASSAKITGSGSADQKTEFEVKISILNPGDELRPGMTASSDIVTDTKEDVINIPIQCVAVKTPEQLELKAAEDGDAIAATLPDEEKYATDRDGFVEVVFVINDGVVNAKQVKTGIQSETHIEILDGIGEKAEIVTGSYRAISKDLKNGSAVVVDNNPEKKN